MTPRCSQYFDKITPIVYICPLYPLNFILKINFDKENKLKSEDILISLQFEPLLIPTNYYWSLNTLQVGLEKIKQNVVTYNSIS